MTQRTGILQTGALLALATLPLAFSACGVPRPTPAPTRRDPPAFNGERAFRDLATQVEFGPRFAGEMAHLRTAEWLATTLRALADEVTVDPFMAHGREFRNIKARFKPGSDARVLLCAHWDSRPVADHDPHPSRRKTPIAGANDGASGVAVLLELARIFHDHPPAIGVDIVLFDGEDFGDFNDISTVLLGSQHYASKVSGNPPRFGILLDMIGDADLQILREGASDDCCASVNDKVWRAAAALGHDQIFVDARGSSLLDDHIPLIRAGLMVIDLIDFTYPHWHTTSDTVDKTSAHSLEVVGRVVQKVVYEEVP